MSPWLLLSVFIHPHPHPWIVFSFHPKWSKQMTPLTQRNRSKKKCDAWRRLGSLNSKKLFLPHASLKAQQVLFLLLFLLFLHKANKINGCCCVLFGGQSSVYIVVELTSQSIKTIKALSLKVQVSWLIASLLYTQQGYMWEAGESTDLPSCFETEERPVTSRLSPAGSPMGTTCVIVHMLPPHRPTLNSSSRDINHPTMLPNLLCTLPGHQSDGSLFKKDVLVPTAIHS